MIISRAPLRVSFFGGGSDIASFYKQQPGAVISTTINKYIYIAVDEQFDGRIRINYSKTETVTEVNEIENNLVRESLKLTNIKRGIHVVSIADVPSEGTGMGSSSAYVVGLLNALYSYQGKNVNAETLARQACQIEIDILKKPIGKQDQYIAAYGGFQYIKFNSDGSAHVDPIICNLQTKKKLEDNLLLFYTGITRSSDPILAKQSAGMKSDIHKIKTMSKMVTLVEEIRDALNKNKLDSFGELLHENWLLKKQMTDGITNTKIDNWYRIARENGAVGGKLLGAGGGGFLLFYAPVVKHKQIISALSNLAHQEFAFEPQGSKIIFID